MLRRSVYLLTGFVFQGVVLTFWVVAKGADRTLGFVTLGVDRTVALVAWGVGRTTGLADGAWGTLIRLWDAVRVEQAAAVAAELPENTWGSLRSYVERLGETARCRTRYHSISRRLSARYKELRKAR